MKLTARPWKETDLLNDLQEMIEELPNSYTSTSRNTLCQAKAYLEEYFGVAKGMPFKKIRDRIRKDGSRFQAWEGERYYVMIDFYSAFCSVRTEIKDLDGRYTPFLYIRTDSKDLPVGVEIQTTSFGALDSEEYEKFFEAIKWARIDAKSIDAFFVQPLRENRFEMGELME